jgi:hypothetical protein
MPDSMSAWSLSDKDMVPKSSRAITPSLEHHQISEQLNILGVSAPRRFVDPVESAAFIPPY